MGRDCLIVPEYTFGVRLEDASLMLSREHTECAWLDYESACARLKYNSNRTALWELNRRIERGLLK